MKRSWRTKSSAAATFCLGALLFFVVVLLDRKHLQPRHRVSLKEKLALFKGDNSPDLPSPPNSDDGRKNFVPSALPTKAGGGVDFERVKQDFLFGRQHPPTPTKKNCRQCYLSSRCYDKTLNLWHPSRCGGGAGVRYLSAPEVASSCANVSLIFAGDSRIRALFGATMAAAYGETTIHRYLDDDRPQTISVRNVTASNYAMAQGFGGLQRDMWTFKYQGDFKDSRNFKPESPDDEDDEAFFLRRKEVQTAEDNATFTSLAVVNDHHNLATDSAKRFLFVWDYYLEASREVLRKEIVDMAPRAVVLEGGLWFVWRRKTDWDKYEKNLDQAITNLKRIRKKLNVHFDVILFLNDEPTRMDEFKLNKGDIDRLNDIARNVAEKHPTLIVWDSYLSLQKEYVRLCNNFHIPTDDEYLWRCDDSVHSGLVMYTHYAQMLFNQYCS